MTLFGARFAKTNIKGESTITRALFWEILFFINFRRFLPDRVQRKQRRGCFITPAESALKPIVRVCVCPSVSFRRAQQSFLYSNSLHIITYNNFCAAAVVIITIKKAIVDTSRGCFGAADVRQMRPSSSF